MHRCAITLGRGVRALRPAAAMAWRAAATQMPVVAPTAGARMAPRGMVRQLHTAIAVHGKVMPFILPDIGEGNAEVEVLEWYVGEGDTVEEFDAVLNVQSDKAATDMTSRYAGKIVKIHFDVGEVAPTGATLFDIEVEGDVEEAADEAPAAAAAAPAAAPGEGKVVPFILPDIGEGNAEVEVLEWYVGEGDTVEEFDAVLNVQSDKAATDMTSRYAGKIVKIHYDVGDTAPTGAALFDILVAPDAVVDGDAPTPEPSAAAPAAPAASAGGARSMMIGGKVLATPAVRRIGREHNVDLSLVPGTGKDGRILKGDILAFIKNGGVVEEPVAPAATPSAAPSAPVSTPAPAVAAGEDVVVQLTGIQRAMAKSMNAAWSVPHFGYCDEICMDALIQLRQQIKPLAEARGVKFSFLPLIMKAVSLSLGSHPSLNAHVNPECTEVTQRAAHNIGIAMDTPKGLIVPNVKNVQIAAELNRLQELASSGKLGGDDLQGGTFTLSNIGAIGGTYASPVLLVPQVAIGALGKTSVVPAFAADGSVVPKSVMQVSWAADHRTVDGATMARFSNEMKLYLEDPLTMLSSMK